MGLEVISAIEIHPLDLEKKRDYYYDQLEKRELLHAPLNIDLDD